MPLVRNLRSIMEVNTFGRKDTLPVDGKGTLIKDPKYGPKAPGNGSYTAPNNNPNGAQIASNQAAAKKKPENEGPSGTSYG